MTILKNVAPGRSHTFRNSVRRSGPDAARAAAVACLARRDYPRAGPAAKLRTGGFDEETTAAVLADLAREGALDDERYAHNYVSSQAARGRGPVRIALQLKGLGVSDTLIDCALRSGPDWGALARKARTARFGARPPAGWPEKAKQARFLQYRGFSADHIRSPTGADPETD